MRAARRTTLGVAVLVAIAVALPASAFAATVQQLQDLAAVTYQMACAANADQVFCQNRTGWTARIMPGGPPAAQETALITVAQANPPLDSVSQSWMTDMHQTACGDP